MNDTSFLEEIRSQPEALRKLAGYYRGDEGVSLVKKAAAEILRARKVVAAGMGSSLYSLYLLEMETVGIVPALEIRDASELLHFGMSSFRGDETIVAVSQSGESAGTKKVVEALEGRVRIVSIVNDMTSFMGMHADIVLPLCAGDERTISTKTYTNTLAVLSMLSVCINGGDMSGETDLIDRAADLMERHFDDSARAAEQAADYFERVTCLHCIARGGNMVAARQLALILKEGAGVFAEALTAGQFRHGPIELAGAGHAAVCIMSGGCEPYLTAGLAAEIAGLGSRILVLTDSEGEYGFPHESTLMNVHIETGGLPSRYFPVVGAPFMEYFVHWLALGRGRTAGSFIHATKITTRE